MNEVIEMPRRESAGLVAGEVHQYSAVEIRQRVNLIQEILRTLMIEGTHYGVIPGTKKPSLYKAGAEMLCVTFRIADKYQIEDLTVDGMARYRIKCLGEHQITGTILGEGLGECSSHEEKYKWRGSICTEEFVLAPENMRRHKFSKWDNKIKKIEQIRTESADQANTILKMACKRAKIAMTLNVTGASDIFTQDIEDLPEELRTHEAAEHHHAQQQTPLAEPPPELLKAAQDAAAAGVAAYQQFFGGTGAPNRKSLAAHHENLKAAAIAADQKRTVDAAPVRAEPAVMSPELEPLLADLNAIADEGLETFEQAWGGLSKATQDKLAGSYSALKTYAESKGAAK